MVLLNVAQGPSASKTKLVGKKSLTGLIRVFNGLVVNSLSIRARLGKLSTSL